MNAPVIPRKPLPEPARAYLDGSNGATADFGSLPTASSPPVQQTKHANITAFPREVPAPDDDDKPLQTERRHGLEFGVFFAGIKTSTLGSTLTHNFNNFLPPHQRYFNNHISRRTLLIMIGVTLASLLALIIGLAAGLSIGSNNALPSPGGAQESGEMTFYNPALGACGSNHGDNDAVMAISHAIWDENQVGQNPNTNPLCGKKIRAHRVDERTGRDASIEVYIVDRCGGCARNDIDVSPAMFDKLADKGKGRVNVEWSWA